MDYQASTPSDPRVVEAMLPYFQQIFANPHASDHAFGWEAAAAIEQARERVARLIGAFPEEIFFTSGATESNNHVMHAAALSAAEIDRKTILVSALEHPSVLQAAEASVRHGMKVLRIPVDNKGILDQEWLANNLTEDVFLVSVMAANNEIGTIQDIRSLVSQAHAAGALFHCDATQAFPALDVDVGLWDVDYLSLSAHKMYGPKGVGALYVRSDLQESFPPLFYGGAQQSGIRSGTLPTPLCVGFGVAADIMEHARCAEAALLAELKALFIRQLDVAGLRFKINGVIGDGGHPGNLSVSFQDIDASLLLGKLQPLVAASTGSACNSGMITQSHVLASIGCSLEEAQRTVRFSLGRFSDAEQVQAVVAMITAGIQEELL